MILLVIGSIIADIDHPGSLIGRYFIVGEILFNGHRNTTHTFLAAILFSIPVILYDLVLGFVFFFSYLLHLVADTLTMSGIKWFYPLLDKRYSLKIFKTGDVYEYLLILFCIQYIFLSF